MEHALLLFVAGAVAGAMNALAGGGSFVTFPALVFAGLPSVVANATSTVALVPATLASVWAYTTGAHKAGFVEIGGVPLPRLTAVSTVGGLAGAALLLSTPTAVFDAVIPWLLLAASITFAAGPQAIARLRTRARLGRGAVLPTQFLLGVYGGYFGGAVGLMMLAAWSLLSDHELKALNPTRVMVVAATNTAAVIYFMAAREVWWTPALVMLAGGLVGGFAGARVGQRLPPGITRGAIVAVTVITTVVFFARAYR